MMFITQELLPTPHEDYFDASATSTLKSRRFRRHSSSVENSRSKVRSRKMNEKTRRADVPSMHFRRVGVPIKVRPFGSSRLPDFPRERESPDIPYFFVFRLKI